MKYILAVDGSEQSLDATRAFEMLSPAEQLTVFHVVNVPGIPYPAIGAGVAKDLAVTVEKGLKEEGERLLNQVESLLPLHPGKVVKQMEIGVPAEKILDAVSEQKPDLLVFGARGMGQIRGTLLGSVSHRVMTHAPCSTLTVKRPLRAINHVLIPLESPEDGAAIVRFFQKVPFRDNLTVTVLHVIPFGDPVWPVGAMITPEFRNEMIAAGEKFTKEAAAQLQKLGHRANGSVAMGSPSRTILDRAAEVSADLIVMRTHSRTGLSRFLLGSVSHAVVHHADASIILVRD